MIRYRERQAIGPLERRSKNSGNFPSTLVVMWNYYDHEHLVGTHYKDFRGIDYINQKLPVPANLEPGPYRFDPPVRTSSRIKTIAGEERPFRHSLEIGYND